MSGTLVPPTAPGGPLPAPPPPDCGHGHQDRYTCKKCTPNTPAQPK